MHFKLNPVGGDPSVPTGVDTSAINGIWGNVLWGVAVVAAFALIGCGIRAWSNHRHGEDNAGVQKAGMVFGALFFMGAIPALVGTVTGT